MGLQGRQKQRQEYLNRIEGILSIRIQNAPLPVPNRQQQRQEYLMEKARSISKWFGGSILMVGVLFAFAACISLAVLSLVPFNASDQAQYLLSFCFVLLAIGGAIAFSKIFRFVNEVKQLHSQIPYVPPVTLDTLPAEE